MGSSLSVGLGGCFAGVNGCDDHLLLDLAKSAGIGPSLFFTILCPVTGLCCSLILLAPFQGGVAKQCKGGGSAATKIVISSGTNVNGWIVPLRILLTALYMSGGNPLGTEGPIIHLSASLGVWLVSKSGKKRRKFLSTFGVIGAAAGMSAGFNVLVTGFVYVIEELTRSLSRKLAIILAFAAGVAVLVTDILERSVEYWIPIPHPKLVPSHEIWAKLTDADINLSLLLCVPIGVLSGFAGWVFTQCAWAVLTFLNPGVIKHAPSRIRRIFLPEVSHLAIVGIVCGLLGTISYEVTGMNGVWGTTADAVPEALTKGIPWEHMLLLFLTKFAAFILATGAGGPGGALVPSLVTGGFLGLTVSRFVGANENVCSACAVIGMGSMFASVMQLPLSGVILMFEFTRANKLLLHIVIANFIASNVVCRLPHGSHSFVHRTLAHNDTWMKLHERDFIETDEQEHEADVEMFNCSLRNWLMNDSERLRSSFDGWRDVVAKRHKRWLKRLQGRAGDAKSSDAMVEPSAHMSKESFESNASSMSGPIERKMSNGSGFDIPKRSMSGTSSKDGSKEASDEGPRAMISLDSFERPGAMMSRESFASKNSNDSSFAGQDLEAVRQQRRENREMWEKVSSVLPALNFRVWKSLNRAQRTAIAELASLKTNRSDAPIETSASI